MARSGDTDRVPAHDSIAPPPSTDSAGIGSPPEALSVHAYRRGAAEVLAVSGDVDLATAPRLREEIARCLQNAPRTLVLDLTGVAFLASVGLSVLIETQETAAPNTVLRIVANQRTVLRPIQATALDQVLSVFPTVEDATVDDAAVDDAVT